MTQCSPYGGFNGGPCGPAPCTGECRGEDTRQRFVTSPCGCISAVGDDAYDIHDPVKPGAA